MSLFAIPAPQALTIEPPAPAFDPDLADELAAVQLAHDLAAWLDVDVQDVWHILVGRPYAMLETPQGWAALAEIVAAELGLPSPGYTPRLH